MNLKRHNLLHDFLNPDMIFKVKGRSKPYIELHRVSRFSSTSPWRCFRNFNALVLPRIDQCFFFFYWWKSWNHGQIIFRYFPFQLFFLCGKKYLWTFSQTENLRSSHCRNILSYNYHSQYFPGSQMIQFIWKMKWVSCLCIHAVRCKLTSQKIYDWSFNTCHFPSSVLPLSSKTQFIFH